MLVPETNTRVRCTGDYLLTYILQASGADGAPCVRYAGGTAPLAALQELAESLARKPQRTVDD